jgi:hypothetical protein
MGAPGKYLARMISYLCLQITRLDNGHGATVWNDATKRFLASKTTITTNQNVYWDFSVYKHTIWFTGETGKETLLYALFIYVLFTLTKKKVLRIVHCNPSIMPRRYQPYLFFFLFFQAAERLDNIDKLAYNSINQISFQKWYMYIKRLNVKNEP